MHGFARLRLVRANPIDGMEECHIDDCPQPLPFPTCVRTLPRKGGGNAGAHGAEQALDMVTLSLARLRAELERDDGPDDSPRAA